MELKNLPIIDWDLALRLTGQDKSLAEDMLKMISNSLPADIVVIKACYDVQNYPELLKCVHKLHGAICYTGLTRLKRVIEQLETDLKNKVMSNVPSLINQLDIETHLLLAR